MSRDLQIANRLRAAGLVTVEVNGWQSRGSDSFNPVGSLDHHTAGGPFGNAPSLSTVINGRADLHGPLCNVLQGRDNTMYVVASGRCNHAGIGAWRGVTNGNTSFFGIERENVGTPAEPWRPDQTYAAAVAHAALIRGCARPDPQLVCGHREYALPPGRKPDAHSVDYDTFRAVVGAALNPPPPTPPPPPPPPSLADVLKALQFLVFTMKVKASKGTVWTINSPTPPEVKMIQASMVKAGQMLAVDGAYGPNTAANVKWFQAVHHLTADGIVGARTLNAMYP